MRNSILTGAVAIASVAAISFGTVSTASAAPAYKPYPHQIHNMVAPKAKISQGYFTSASPEHPKIYYKYNTCLLYTSPSPRDVEESRMPSSA